MTDPAGLADDIAAEVSTVLVGMDEQVERLTIALLTRGHVLLEGVPGVAKTTLANTFARASGLTYNRVQMTPDVLPADITGTSVYREETGEFELRRGPVFANVVVADEINRATPKTQSALLEAMAERHVTIDGETLDLPEPFLVVATQNPIEMEGTFELPEAQRDRFQQKLLVDLPNADDERALLERFNGAPTMGPEDVNAVVSTAEIQAARDVVTNVHVEDVVQDYILEIVAASRDHADVAHGASPRGSLALLHTAKARAAIHGRDYVISDDVKQLIDPVLRHRLVLTTDADLSDVTAANVIEDLRSSVTPPEGKVTDADLLTEEPPDASGE
ncbi:AAA family ATPase [Haloarcula amylovorans]|uniref:AAA family ATPase n=1 Tax=Haloarcula amylovorans TaxID=2562280 RepID=UPI001076869D|nr:MoxR family ATPase [Halomicroarcula amylolytica]